MVQYIQAIYFTISSALSYHSKLVKLWLHPATPRIDKIRSRRWRHCSSRPHTALQSPGKLWYPRSRRNLTSGRLESTQRFQKPKEVRVPSLTHLFQVSWESLIQHSQASLPKGRTFTQMVLTMIFYVSSSPSGQPIYVLWSGILTV